MNDPNVFQYTYSAQDQSEVARIRNKYLAPHETKLEQLRKLDRIPGRKALCRALVLGILGALILGTGMSLVMTDLGEFMGLENSLLPGILIGLAGIVPMALAYPVYSRTLAAERRRIAPEILRLSDELMK